MAGRWAEADEAVGRGRRRGAGVARRRPRAAALGSTHATRAVPKALLACLPGRPAGSQRCGRSARVSSPRASAVAHSPPPQRRRARGGVRRQARCEAPGAVWRRCAHVDGRDVARDDDEALVALLERLDHFLDAAPDHLGLGGLLDRLQRLLGELARKRRGDGRTSRCFVEPSSSSSSPAAAFCFFSALSFLPILSRRGARGSGLRSLCVLKSREKTADAMIIRLASIRLDVKPASIRHFCQQLTWAGEP